MKNNKEDYRNELIATVRDLAEELIKLAPDLVGDADLIHNFEIHLEFPLPHMGKVPSIKLVREHYSEFWHDRQMKRTEIIFKGE